VLLALIMALSLTGCTDTSRHDLPDIVGYWEVVDWDGLGFGEGRRGISSMGFVFNEDGTATKETVLSGRAPYYSGSWRWCKKGHLCLTLTGEYWVWTDDERASGSPSPSPTQHIITETCTVDVDPSEMLLDCGDGVMTLVRKSDLEAYYAEHGHWYDHR
jgi:hypothetical protein